MAPLYNNRHTPLRVRQDVELVMAVVEWSTNKQKRGIPGDAEQAYKADITLHGGKSTCTAAKY